MNNQQTDLFWELLANPADKSYAHVQNLRKLVSEYPQSSLLQSLLLYVGEDDKLGHAVAYADSRLLYKLRHDAGSLLTVSDDQLVNTTGEKKYFHSDTAEVAGQEQETHTELPESGQEQPPPVDGDQPTVHFFEPQVEEEHTPPTPEPETIAEPEKLDDLINYGDEVTTGEHELQPPVTEFHHTEQETKVQQSELAQEAPAAVETIPQSEHALTDEEEQPVAAAVPEDTIIEQLPHEETAPEPHIEQETELPTPGFYVPDAAAADEDSYSGGDISSRLYETYAEAFENTPQPAAPIEDEVFEEIVSIDDINLASPESFAAPDSVTPQTVEETEAPALGFAVPPVADAPKEESSKNRRVDLTDEAEKLMLSNIAATDFFVFDHALSERIKAGDEGKEAALSSAAEQQEPAEKPQADKKGEYQRLTRYFDEKMPYSFMWWLDKTRKEHSGIYQPFVLDTSRKIEKDIPDELQQQYYENIFQLTSVDELERTTGTEPVVFDSRKKEDDIIERFIHEAPQIKPQTSEKLDNENKAKRSSEDQDDIVTETLALVYADQMLYHKAIKVYQKLMLKFPEKSRYFAGQIEQLEKKIT